MNSSLHLTVQKWLKLAGFTISTQYLKRKLLSHPEVYSLASITDTLDELGIPYKAIVVDKNEIENIPTPFLAHIDKVGQFVLVKDIKNINSKFPSFLDRWNQIVVVAMKHENWKDQTNSVELKNRKFQKNLLALISIIFISLISISLSLTFEIKLLILTIVGILGVLVSMLIVSKDLGVESAVVNQVCGNYSNCNAVLKSTASKLFGISLSDFGITWFSFLIINLIINSFFSSNQDSFLKILSIFSISAIPFCIYSVYYQALKIKKWCGLCLSTASLLSIQAITVLEDFRSLFTTGLPISLFVYSILALTSLAIIWQVLKVLIKQKIETETENFANLRVKRNPFVFSALLRNQQSTKIESWDGDLQLGNSASPIQIIVASNPYCVPCAAAHKILQDITTKFDYGFILRFAIKAKDKSSRKTLATEYFLKVMRKNSGNLIAQKRIIDDWYEHMNFDWFAKKYPVEITDDVSVQLEKNDEWADSAQIDFTPTIFVNGYQLPRHYRVEELLGVVNLFAGYLDNVEQVIRIQSSTIYENGPEGQTAFVATKGKESGT